MSKKPPSRFPPSRNPLMTDSGQLKKNPYRNKVYPYPAPTKPGYYWWRRVSRFSGKRSEWQVVSVDEHLAVWQAGDECEVYYDDGEWGPEVPPFDEG